MPMSRMHRLTRKMVTLLDNENPVISYHNYYTDLEAFGKEVISVLDAGYLLYIVDIKYNEYRS